MTSENKITLRSSDGEIFEVSESIMNLSQTIKNMIEDVDCANNVTPLPNVTSKTLAKVIEYCKKHVAEYGADLKTWDREFAEDIDQSTLLELVLAANYLNIKSLLDFTCQIVADGIKDMPPEKITKTFNIKK